MRRLTSAGKHERYRLLEVLVPERKDSIKMDQGRKMGNKLFFI
jgi:hypothetical protein